MENIKIQTWNKVRMRVYRQIKWVTKSKLLKQKLTLKQILKRIKENKKIIIKYN